MRTWLKALTAAIVLAAGWRVLAGAAEQNSSGFPDGYDAVQAAPDSHRVVFENALVRVLQVTIPPAGKTEPMHHHRWPGFFLDWDTGGRSPHIRYHRPDGSIREIPSKDNAVHPGHWTISWLNPEPMHSIEVVERYDSAQGPPELRVEIKSSP
jgi:hypothetical protein